MERRERLDSALWPESEKPLRPVEVKASAMMLMSAKPSGLEAARKHWVREPGRASEDHGSLALSQMRVLGRLR